MLFNSLQFLVFFPVVTAGFFLLPHRLRWLWLLVASCLFYMAYVPQYILILIATILVDYFAAFRIEKTEGRARDGWLAFSILSTVAILFVFKYFNFVNDNIDALARLLHWNYSKPVLELALPIGLSFHTFQSLSYVIEVHRGRQKPERDFGIYALYVMFYPQLVAGPIERPQNLLWQFHKHHHFNMEAFTSGLFRMLWGLFKKVVIADRLSVYVDMVYSNPGQHQGLEPVLATVFFAIQIYCDFSGYSDMALGAAEVMGFRLMRNFDKPYSSRNLSEFWKRWHISLSSWFYDYLYNPLVVEFRDWGRWAIVAGLIATFLVSGIWHGAGWTYIAWGLIHGLGLSLLFLTTKWRRKVFKPVPSWLLAWIGTASTFAFVCFGYVFFRASSMEAAIQILRSMGGGFRASLPFGSGIETLVDMGITAVFVPLMFLGERVYDDNPFFNLCRDRPLAVRWAAAWAAILVIANFGSFSNAHSFIYFQF